MLLVERFQVRRQGAARPLRRLPKKRKEYLCHVRSGTRPGRKEISDPGDNAKNPLALAHRVRARRQTTFQMQAYEPSTDAVVRSAARIALLGPHAFSPENGTIRAFFAKFGRMVTFLACRTFPGAAKER